MLKQILAAAAALTLLAPIAAQAQEVPSYATVASTDQQIQGRVTGFDGGYNLTVRDDNGYLDNVAALAITANRLYGFYSGHSYASVFPGMTVAAALADLGPGVSKPIQVGRLRWRARHCSCRRLAVSSRKSGLASSA